MTAIVWIACALALVTLLISVINLLSWPRGRDGTRLSGAGVSVLIPARNEERNIEQCVRSVFAALPDVFEVLVYDDQSVDATPKILANLCAEFPALRVVQAVPLPPDWIGKPHACARLATQARGDLLVFTDADVTFAEAGLQRLGELFERFRADVVTAVPHQVMGSPVERLILPLLHLTYLSFLPQLLVHRSRDVRVLAANGQLLAMRRKTYDAIAGFEAVRSEIVDDMAICRNAKTSGARVVFADGDNLASCRMYATPRDVWRGFSKNLYEGIGGTVFALVFVIALYLTTFVVPWVALAASLAPGMDAWLAPALIGVAANLAQRTIQAIRHRQPLVSVMLHLPSIVAFVALAINSWWWTRTNQVQWSGRTYAARSQRPGVV